MQKINKNQSSSLDQVQKFCMERKIQCMRQGVILTNKHRIGPVIPPCKMHHECGGQGCPLITKDSAMIDHQPQHQQSVPLDRHLYCLVLATLQLHKIVNIFIV